MYRKLLFRIELAFRSANFRLTKHFTYFTPRRPKIIRRISNSAIASRFFPFSKREFGFTVASVWLTVSSRNIVQSRVYEILLDV